MAVNQIVGYVAWSNAPGDHWTLWDDWTTEDLLQLVSEYEEWLKYAKRYGYAHQLPGKIEIELAVLHLHCL